MCGENHVGLSFIYPVLLNMANNTLSAKESDLAVPLSALHTGKLWKEAQTVCEKECVCACIVCVWGCKCTKPRTAVKTLSPHRATPEMLHMWSNLEMMSTGETSGTESCTEMSITSQRALARSHKFMKAEETRHANGCRPARWPLRDGRLHAWRGLAEAAHPTQPPIPDECITPVRKE
ncbi:hypothetical protein KUDE01_024221 [Dissostichus eleginoides]|uniref:Uncharacterized protein n=1 Tax=Dissostichus eleginoides TaxID=100907 RepID=A0AAD9BE81_DISEL|nr:hypothetical protein KUDE01_024221 [Dissostichus eleginoides]